MQSSNIFSVNHKEKHLSKRRNNRALAQQFQDPLPTVVNKPLQLDNYRKQPRKVHLVPRTRTQEDYIELLDNPDKLIVFATGPAGTGKTMMAVLAALKAYQTGECTKIIVTRPAVGVDDEEHGFLPGDLNAKMAPWTRPIMDYIGEYYRPQDINAMLEDQLIEISPLAYMRGRTFKNAWIIADEMQNATPNQMKMLLTRLGEGSKLVVTGDTQQTDRRESENGLLDFKRLVKEYESCQYVAGIEFGGRDIQRHPAVLEILKIYKEI
jgi:phosphate starvation-inducible PhoH-like protein